MKLRAPYTGVVVDASEQAVERLVARGFTPLAPAKEEKQDKKPAKKAAKKK